MVTFDEWRTRAQKLAQSLESIGRDATPEQIQTRQSELVGRLLALTEDLEQPEAIPQPREDRREAWAGSFRLLTDQVRKLSEQTNAGPTIRCAKLLSATLAGKLLETLSRIYELDNIVKSEPPNQPSTAAESELASKSSPDGGLPRLDVHYDGKLGSGAFGSVWQATDQLLERGIAVKFLTSTDQFLDAEALLREARSLAKITHPNLVTVFAAAWLKHPDTGLVAPAIIMELLLGVELQKWQNQQHTRSEALRVASGILTGVAAMHGANLHHGDLHTENVMVLTDGTAKLIDWRYQDSFIAKSTAHRRELVGADQRRALDLIATMLEKQGLTEESLAIRRSPDFESARTSITNFIEPQRSRHVPDDALHEAFEKWRSERSIEIATAPPLPLNDGPALALHVSSKRAITGNVEIDLVNRDPIVGLLAPMGASSFNHFYDVDSIVAADAETRESKVFTYTRLFESGALELVLVLSPGSSLNSIALYAIKALAKLAMAPRNLGLSEGCFVALDVMRAKGTRVAVDHVRHLVNDLGKPVSKDSLSPRTIAVDALRPGDADRILQPALDRIWREAGFPKCFLYDSNGRFQGI